MADAGRPALADRFFELFEKRDLCGIDLLAGRFEREPGSFVYFGEGLGAAAAAGPFEFEGVADELRGVEVAGYRPCIDAFAAFLTDGAEGLEGTFEGEAGFLAEFADGGVEGRLIARELSLWDRPTAGILFLPEGSSRMNKEYFEMSVQATV